MLDIELFRQKPEIVRKDLKKRGDSEKLKWVDEIIEMDSDWKKLKVKIDELRSRRNKISMEINEAKKAGKDVKKILADAKKIPDEIAKLEIKQNELQGRIKNYLMRMPNILHESVPVGKDENDNKVIKEIGKRPNFKFTPKNHVDIIEKLNITDIPRAAKISGARFWFLKGDLALLDLALQHYAVDFMKERGYLLVEPPFMMNRSAYEGVTDLADFEQVMYKVEGEDLYLIATSEHPLTAQYQDEILELDKPIKLAGISTNFRKEAGAHGKDTKGIFRGHQFNKIEQIILCKPEESWKLHEELLKNIVDFFTSLEIPIRIVNICTGDIGTVAAKKYDVDAWMPAQSCYREVGSCSNCTDYQARRLRIRYKTNEGNKTAHTLNSTCVATSRALVAIIENFQNIDGSINIPKVLIPYMNGLKKIEKH